MSAGSPNGFDEIPIFGAEEPFYYEFKRSVVEGKDVGHFLEFFDIARIQRAGRLHSLFGSIVFAIGGYDHDDRVLHQIPEVRAFLRELVGRWPYFFYADALENEFLTTLIQCLIDPSVTILRDDDPENFTTQFSPAEANQVCKPLFDGLVRACGMNDQLNQALFDVRVAAIHKHLQRGVR